MASSGERWIRYYNNTTGRPPRPTLLRALDSFERPGFAVDLGCGDGRDTIELLRRGWSVLGIDSEPAAIARLNARPDRPADARLETRAIRFEDADWPVADLVNASFSLFFSEPEGFSILWRKLFASIRTGGRFAGQLLGERDSWSRRANIVHFERADLDRLLARFVVEMLETEEEDAVTPTGEAKHWHIYHLVLRKP
jgi:tellurite methyltransferase